MTSEDSRAWKSYKGPYRPCGPLTPKGFKSTVRVPPMELVILPFLVVTIMFMAVSLPIVWWSYSSETERYEKCLKENEAQIRNAQTICAAYGYSCYYEARDAVCASKTARRGY